MEPIPIPATKWHWLRRLRILRDHPEVRALHGPEPKNAPIMGTMVVVQLLVACNVHRLPFIALVLLAATVGAYITYGFQVRNRCICEGGGGMRVA
jgi:hypothetical protein